MKTAINRIVNNLIFKPYCKVYNWHRNTFRDVTADDISHVITMAILAGVTICMLVFAQPQYW